MENGKQEAFGFAARLDGENIYSAGLTKREYFAVHIATGLSVQTIAGNHNSIQMMEIDVPLCAVRIADGLLKALETKPK